MNLGLIRSGYLPINVKFEDREKHHDAFNAYYCDGSANAMISLVGEYGQEQLERNLEILGEDE